MRLFKSMRIGWHENEDEFMYKILNTTSEGRGPLGRSRLTRIRQ
jgi:hypothetical protein